MGRAPGWHKTTSTARPWSARAATWSATSKRAVSVRGDPKAAVVVSRGGEERVADGMPSKLAAAEAMLEDRGQKRAVGERDQAPTEVAGRGDSEGRAQAPARPAVVGHRHDGGDLARVAAGGPPRGPQAVGAAQGDRRPTAAPPVSGPGWAGGVEAPPCPCLA